MAGESIAGLESIARESVERLRLDARSNSRPRRRKRFLLVAVLLTLVVGVVSWKLLRPVGDPRFVGTWTLVSTAAPGPPSIVNFRKIMTKIDTAADGSRAVYEWDWSIEGDVLELRQRQMPNVAAPRLVQLVQTVYFAFKWTDDLPTRLRILKVDRDRIQLRTIPALKQNEPEDVELIRNE